MKQRNHHDYSASNLMLLLALVALLAGIFAVTASRGVRAGAMASFLVTNANDTGSGSLRQAMQNAANSNEADTITFNLPAGPQTINLMSALPDIVGDLTIVGPGANLLTVRRATDSNFRIFTIPNIGSNAAISGLTIREGRTNGSGGGISSLGNLTLTDCAILNNEALGGGFGGGVSLLFGNGTFTGCTFSGNLADGNGGGIAYRADDFGETLTLTNCTISGNAAGSGGKGGGIYHANQEDASTLQITNCTIASNTSLTGGGVFTTLESSSGIASTRLRNTIVANNTLPNLSASGGSFGATVEVISQGNNLASDNGSGSLNATGDLINTDPLLAPLGDYGGPTQTRALLPGSPAINAGTSTSAPTNDQRGIARPQGAASDIGAVERRLTQVTTIADSGAGSLRQALTNANAEPGADTISFNLPGGLQTINLASVLPDITDTLTIAGSGAKLLKVRRASGGNYRIFNIVSGIPNGVSISGLTIADGKVTSGTGGGIRSQSPLTLTNCIVTGNEASDSGGGVILTQANGAFQGCTFSNNITGNSGGGIEFSGSGGFTLAMINCTLSGNTASIAGGGIRNFGSSSAASTLQVINCTVADNTSGSANGGGINNLIFGNGVIATTQLRNTIFAGNTLPNLKGSNPDQFVSQGGNLASDGGNGYLNGPGDLLNADPLLAPLSDNGGSTPTHALPCGSPAINGGASLDAPATDQRGVLRGNNVDIGAFEANISLGPGALPAAALGTPYSQNFTASGSITPYIFDMVAGALPGGLTLSPGGQLSGVPNASGSFNFTVRATSGNGLSGVCRYTLTVGCPVVTVSPNTLTPGVVGTVYNTVFSQTGGAGAITWSLTGTLPNGLTFNPASVRLSGTPAQSGSFPITVTATDANGCQGEKSYSLVITQSCGAITLNPSEPTLPPGVAGTAYNQTFTQTGGAGAVSFTLSAGAAPGGVTLSSDGALSGTPTAFGNFSFTIKATDATGCTGERAYILVINPPCGTITINPATLTGGVEGQIYSAAASATGGTAPYIFTVNSGDLPGGLSLNASTGAITGTPNLAGSFTFTIKATDAKSCEGTRGYTVTISPAVVNNGLQFYPLAAPMRLLDTRPGVSPNACSQPNAPIAGGTSRAQSARNFCGIPANAQAVTGNITTVASGGGYLTLYPSSAPQPLVASTNYLPNEVVNNVFTVGVSAGDGAFKIFALNTTDVVVDVTGYYAPPAPAGLYFHPLPKPIRLLETRPGQTGCDTPAAPIQAGDAGIRSQLGRLTCNGVTIPSGALALVGNATTVSPQGIGYLTLYPAGAAKPLVASSNYNANQVVNGPFAVGLSASGRFNIFTAAATHLVVDVLGYYSAEASDVNGTGLLFNPLSKPVRLLETRPGQTGCYTPGAPLTGGAEYTQPALGACSGELIPQSALAIVGNATVVNAQGGYLTLWPSTSDKPLVASSNFDAGQVLNRHFTVGLGGDGAFKIFTQFQTDLVVDVSGYFAP